MQLRKTMTFSAVSPMQQASEERPKLPHLKDEIKSLKDGLYSILRIAYLPAWDYFILETDKFKVNIYKKSRPDIFKILPDQLKSSEEMWVLIQGLSWTVVLSESDDGKWIEYANTNSTSWAWEGLIEAYLPLASDTDIDWSPSPF